jgi:thiamine pyrophosphate-dependent acetolactate synthase large subunit-like protein
MLGYEAIPELLHRRGLTAVFAMLAETNGPWLAHGAARGLIDVVRTRHEETAVMAACGFSRTTGGIGVASVTRGPGLANSINALAAAVETHVPILLFTASGPRARAQTQNLEQEGILRLLGTGHVPVHTIFDLPEALDRAIQHALRERRPQVISIDDGVLDQRTELGAGSALGVVDHPGPARDVANAAAVALQTARRPLLLAGGGAVASDARGELERLADRMGAGLGTTLMALGMFSGHSNEVGIVGGWSPREARRYFTSVDVVVSFGARLNRFTMDGGSLFGAATVIQCLIDPADAGSYQVPDLLMVGDARHAARDILQAIGADQEQRAFTGPSIDDIRSSLMDVDIGADRARGLDVRRVARTISEALPRDRIIVTDSGRAVVPLAGLIAARDARSWVHGRGYGSIGQGLGLAIGAATAHPDRQVVLFVGDGAFLAACHDLDAARLASLRNLLVVVLNDERYGMETACLEERGLPIDTIMLSAPDLVALVRAYGGDGIRVSTIDELDALEVPVRRGLFLIDARLDPRADPTAAVGARAGA